MSASSERLAEARWVLERTLAWIAAAEVKVGAVVTIQIAMLGGLAAAFAAATSKGPWSIGSALACAIAACLSLFCAAMAILPRTRGPQNSLLFFGRVAELSEADYAARFVQATDGEVLADWTAQIHRNAEIARDKHWWVIRAVMLSFIAAVPWLSAVTILVLGGK